MAEYQGPRERRPKVDNNAKKIPIIRPKSRYEGLDPAAFEPREATPKASGRSTRAPTTPSTPPLGSGEAAPKEQQGTPKASGRSTRAPTTPSTPPLGSGEAAPKEQQGTPKASGRSTRAPTTPSTPPLGSGEAAPKGAQLVTTDKARYLPSAGMDEVVRSEIANSRGRGVALLTSYSEVSKIRHRPAITGGAETAGDRYALPLIPWKGHKVLVLWAIFLAMLKATFLAFALYLAFSQMAKAFKTGTYGPWLLIGLLTVGVGIYVLYRPMMRILASRRVWLGVIGAIVVCGIIGGGHYLAEANNLPPATRIPLYVIAAIVWVFDVLDKLQGERQRPHAERSVAAQAGHKYLQGVN